MGTASASNISSDSSSSFASPIPEVAQVYACFTMLTAIARQHFAGELGGRLLLFGELDANGAAVSLAANIAGAATLGVDADAERLRRGIRHGFCDFVVNSLDESLRILKNELRRKQAVSVCLKGELAPMLDEAVERGLQPDLLAVSGSGLALGTLQQRGALNVQESPAAALPPLQITWSTGSAPALWLAKVDSLATTVLPAGDERARWLKLAPRYLGRSLAAQHYLRMSAKEADRFEEAVAEAMKAGGIDAQITVRRG